MIVVWYDVGRIPVFSQQFLIVFLFHASNTL